jgi:hypothetical protein
MKRLRNERDSRLGDDMANEFYTGNCEPSVDELLNDQIATLLMRRDGIKLTDIRRIVEETKAALRSRAHSLAAR